jgi:hypothetical protein
LLGIEIVFMDEVITELMKKKKALEFNQEGKMRGLGKGR